MAKYYIKVRERVQLLKNKPYQFALRRAEQLDSGKG